MFLVITNSKHVLYWFCSGCIHLNNPCLWSFCPAPPLSPVKDPRFAVNSIVQFLCLLVVFMSVSIPLGALCYGRLEGGGGKRLLVVPCPKPKGLLMQYIYIICIEQSMLRDMYKIHLQGIFKECWYLKKRLCFCIEKCSN